MYMYTVMKPGSLSESRPVPYTGHTIPRLLPVTSRSYHSWCRKSDTAAFTTFQVPHNFVTFHGATPSILELHKNCYHKMYEPDQPR